MRIICDRLQLLELINTVQKAVAAKAVMPILECIKLDANVDGNLIVTANNLDICIEYHTVCTITEGGSIALSSRMFGDI